MTAPFECRRIIEYKLNKTAYDFKVYLAELGTLNPKFDNKFAQGECTVKLTLKDKALLRSWGHTEDDLSQIETAIHSSKTQYTLEGVPIDREEALRLLGREKYLSGISRSAFHYSAVRETYDGKCVSFDSSRLFK